MTAPARCGAHGRFAGIIGSAPAQAGARCLSCTAGSGAARTAAIMDGSAAVAQLDRVLGYEPRGRGFESCQPRQQNQGLSLFTLGRPRAPGNTGETERSAECLQDSSDCNLIAELI